MNTAEKFGCCVLEILFSDGWYCRLLHVVLLKIHVLDGRARRHVVFRFVVKCYVEENLKRKRSDYCRWRFFYIKGRKEVKC